MVSDGIKVKQLKYLFAPKQHGISLSVFTRSIISMVLMKSISSVIITILILLILSDVTVVHILRDDSEIFCYDFENLLPSFLCSCKSQCAMFSLSYSALINFSSGFLYWLTDVIVKIYWYMELVRFFSVNKYGWNYLVERTKNKEINIK